MKHCEHPGCRGTLFSEPADDFHVGPAGPARTQLVCNFCARIVGPVSKPLPLVHAGRFSPQARFIKQGADDGVS